MSSSNVDRIKERLGIVDVLSNYIKLEKSGGNYKAKCPFHNEKTPSFFVSPVRGSFYCFGCGAKGDIFSFVEQFEGLDFKGALKVLAFKAGIPLEFETNESKLEKDRLFRLLEVATEFFEEKLKSNKEAQDYLGKRGLKIETIKDWRLGFAEAKWQSLIEFCRSKKFKDSELIGAGLGKQTENKKFYDVFRGRIMFPIFDTASRPIAFSGRVLVADEKSPKYLNSPETELFNKSDVLYGFDKAKLSIKKKNYSILVEGQMDLLLSHQAGFDNTVATSGTALTILQLTRLNHLSSRIILAYDGDKAGFKAIERSAKLALSLGMNVRIALLPQGEDPASVIAKDPETWAKIIKDSKHIIDFYLDAILAAKMPGRLVDQEIKKRVLPFVKLLPSNIDQSRFVVEISERTGIHESALREDLKKIAESGEDATVGRENIKKTTPSRELNIAGRIAGIIFWQEGLNKDPLGQKTLREKLENKLNKKEILIELEKRKSELIFEAETYFEGRSDLDSIVEDLFFNLDEEILRNQFNDVLGELKEAEKSGNKEKLQKILENYNEIGKKINKMNERKDVGFKTKNA